MPPEPQEPLTLPQEDPSNVATDTDPIAAKEELVQNLVAMFDEDPTLASKVADFIEHELTLKGSVGTVSMPESQMGSATAASMQGAPMTNPGPATMPQGGQDPGFQSNPFEERLGYVENAYADMALERELGAAKQAYDAMKTHFPILPEFNDKAILEFMVQNQIPSIARAAQLWGMEEMMKGEGTVASRMLTARMQNPRSANLPPVEGPGGNVASNAQLPPPSSMREAQQRARAKAESFFSGRPGA